MPLLRVVSYVFIYCCESGTIKTDYLSLRCLSNTLVPPASTVPLDFTSCYYQSSLLSFTSIAQILQSGQRQHCSTNVCFYLRYFLCGALSYRACVCVLIDVCVHLLLYMFSGQHKIILQHSRSKSSTKPPSPFLTCQFKLATRPLLFSRHPIPSAIAKYTPCEPYTTYFDRPNQSTLLTRLL